MPSKLSRTVNRYPRKAISSQIIHCRSTQSSSALLWNSFVLRFILIIEAFSFRTYRRSFATLTFILDFERHFLQINWSHWYNVAGFASFANPAFHYLISLHSTSPWYIWSCLIPVLKCIDGTKLQESYFEAERKKLFHSQTQFLTMIQLGNGRRIGNLFRLL